MYHILWEYEVRRDRVAEFEALYGPDGAWARLFRSLEGYHGTELLRDTSRPTRFVTIDYWSSAADFERNLPAVREAYDRLDQEASALTIVERRLGAFKV
jgi:heme-degrading monooxygenase HmoA